MVPQKLESEFIACEEMMNPKAPTKALFAVLVRLQATVLTGTETC